MIPGPVVANAGPVIALSATGRLRVVRDLAREWLVPEPVHREILSGGPEGLGLKAYHGATWIHVRSLQGPPDPLLSTVLHPGEASVVQLARELQIRHVFMDEPRARRIARTIYGLTVFGSARALVEAKRRGLIPSVRDALKDMDDVGYWISGAIVSWAVREAGEE
jgi:uncharacterized protein